MKNLLILAFILATSISFGQTFTFKGIVLADDGTPLEGVNIQNLNSKENTISDQHGFFDIECTSDDSLSISYLGYNNLILKNIQPSSKREEIILPQNLNITMCIVTNHYDLEEILVAANRAQNNAPFSTTKIYKPTLTKNNLGQDMPVLLNQLPNVVTTSDAGAGVGYTGIRVRGSDATRVNVTINGIPLNDSESQGTYWVDIPDIASSVSSLQLQRGVGTSTNGTGAFGASLNLLTDGYNTSPALIFNNSIGSFNTRKHTLGLQTGKINEHFSFQGRFSKIKSDGYIDRASSDLNSYYFAGTYLNDKTLVKFLAFGGHEKTYQSWNGIDSTTMATDRTFNSAGAIYDENWNVMDYYDNEVDDYTQNHYQLHLNQQFTPNLNGNIAFHYTKGYGYYEQYKQNKKVSDYGISPTIIGNDTIHRTDLIRRKWLDNDFYGVTTSWIYDNNSQIKPMFGASWNRYDGDHFGEVIWARNAGDSEIRHRYYNNNGLKDDLAVFTKATYTPSNKFIIYADLQFRNVKYKTTDFLEKDIDENINFFNPKFGITYLISENTNLYYSFAQAHKEPNRSDYEYAITPPKSEVLFDHEAGFRFFNGTIAINSNLYYMRYKNQLVLTGEIDDVGNFIRTNVGQSYRLGLEFDMNYRIFKKLTWSPNFSISQNQNVDFIEVSGNSYENLGNTNISYSPNIVAGNTISYQALNNLNFSFITKFVGSQYLANNDTDASKLPAYTFSNLTAKWSIDKKNRFTVKALVNNIFDAKYVSNGYMWGTTAYYFPQAGRNYLIGLDFTLK